jgi:hypothetical protein
MEKITIITSTVSRTIQEGPAGSQTILEVIGF